MQGIKINVNTSYQKTINIFVWFLITFAIGALVMANYYFSYLEVSLRYSLNLVATLIILGIFSFTSTGKRFWKFSQDARNELRKIIWPKKQETVNTTLIIAVVVIVMAIFLWVIDSVLFWVITFITGQRG